MTPDECDDFKKEILREIETHKINIYEFPDHDDEEENRFVPSLTNSLWSRGDSIIWDFMGRLPLPVRDHMVSMKDGWTLVFK